VKRLADWPILRQKLRMKKDSELLSKKKS